MKYIKISPISPQNSYISCQMYFYFVLCLCFIEILYKIKFYAFCIANYVFCGNFIAKCQNCMLYVMFGVLVQHQMCFASKNSHLVYVVKAMFFSFVVNHISLHVSCVLLVFKFYANTNPKLLISNFVVICQN